MKRLLPRAISDGPMTRLGGEPLFRLLAINLVAGVAFALIVVGGLLALDLGGLRRLILADQSPGIAIGLLLFGFVITFGSWVMGTAIMMIGRGR
jgi:hypothetical protein